MRTAQGISGLATAIAALMLFAAPASASERWRGWCTSKDSGTNFGYVGAATRPGLDLECSRHAVHFVVSNVSHWTVADADTGKPSMIVCSAEAPHHKPARQGNTTTFAGPLPGRSCVEGPPDKPAVKLYCEMYDHPTSYHCNNDFNTSNTCPNTAFTGMTVLHKAGKPYRYCWSFNSEDVGRNRDWTLHGDF